ncbi:hypothetical protein PHLCEN_2v7133 [Hermanssonia centrifuga]|uniref:Uncharacterized protein n=1 Tax=Hermanssonia centrifuga TaxID=98765 RepID=A0A2R6NXD2_9APHY|nr:hypothetical protein PHLCEN_2v7133 [Hermanssonia centrifuga]
MQSNGYEPDTEGPLATRKRKLAASVRRVNVKKGLRSKKEPKGKVSRKHVAMDVQFAATVHRSIERQLKCAQEACYSLQSRTHSEAYAGIVEYAISEVQDDSLLEQDKMLVERLRQGLVDQGFKGLHSGFDKLSPPHGLMNPIELAPRPQILVLPPVSLEFPPLLPSLPVQDNMSSTLDSCSEHVDRLRSGVSVSPPIPIPVHRPRTEDPDSFDLATPSLSPPLPSILNFPSPPSPLPELAIPPCNALPSPLTTPPSTRTSHMRRRSHDGLVLEMPQLVASLILRHRDRAASRPRSRSKSDDAGNCTSKARSPLWKTVDVLPQVEL